MEFKLGIFIKVILLIELKFCSPNEVNLDYEIEEYDEVEGVKIQEEINFAPQCRLRGLPLDTSPTNLYEIDPISDNLKIGDIAWTHPIDGPLDYVSVVQTPHFRALTGTSRETAGQVNYLLIGRAESREFTRTFKTREMIRHIVLNCVPANPNDPPSAFKRFYYIKIPVLDWTPPSFLETSYTFTITEDWDRKRPISQGQFVIVGDNAFEIQTDPDFLKFSAIPENIIRWEAHPLWVKPYPETFHYRLDIYLVDSVTLKSGQNFQVALSVRDEFNSAPHTTINIHVQ